MINYTDKKNDITNIETNYKESTVGESEANSVKVISNKSKKADDNNYESTK